MGPNNAFAFGGINSALLLRRGTDDAYRSVSLRYVGLRVGESDAPATRRRAIPIFRPATNPDSAGLYVVSENAGIFSRCCSGRTRSEAELASRILNYSLGHWQMRLALGSLATFAFEAQVLRLGGVDALIAALTQAQEDLGTGRVDVGWVVAIDVAQKQASALRLACFAYPLRVVSLESSLSRRLTPRRLKRCGLRQVSSASSIACVRTLYTRWLVMGACG